MIGAVSKTVVPLRVPRVRIPPPPPFLFETYIIFTRRGDREAEGARLEIVCGVYSFTEGSNPSLSASFIMWGSSSVGRAIRSQRIGRRFDPALLHHFLIFYISDLYGNGACGVDPQILRNASSRTRSGPEGSSLKRCLACVAGLPERSHMPFFIINPRLFATKAQRR